MTGFFRGGGKFVLGLGCALALSGCGSDEAGDGGGGNPGTCPEAEAAECSQVVAPGSDDTRALQTALIEIESGGTLCVCPGTYSVKDELSLTARDVTVRGMGATRDDVVLDYAAQTSGDDGFTATAPGFTIRDLTVKNTPGNGIVADKVTGATFSNLHVSWDAGSTTDNGAYAVYPVGCSQVVVENSEIVGAADAGIYVGQSDQVIVRDNLVHGNVAGIEIENSTNSEVVGNEAWDNSAGILVFLMPNLEKKDGFKAYVHDNDVHDNNHENFAEVGSVVSFVPPGTGMLVLASDETEITGNTIEGNQSVGILVVSLETLNVLLQSDPDPETDANPEKTFIHGNTFANNGADPQGVLAEAQVAPLEDVVWDGVEVSDGSAELCLGTSDVPSFRNFHGLAGMYDTSMHTTDTTAHECTLPELSPVSW